MKSIKIGLLLHIRMCSNMYENAQTCVKGFKKQCAEIIICKMSTENVTISKQSKGGGPEGKYGFKNYLTLKLK